MNENISINIQCTCTCIYTLIGSMYMYRRQTNTNAHSGGSIHGITREACESGGIRAVPPDIAYAFIDFALIHVYRRSSAI